MSAKVANNEKLPLFSPAPPPASKLARYRLLSPHAGIHVSPLQLGGMSIGSGWADSGFGAMDKESSFKLLDAFYEKGGNFIDTANNYQDETSEMTIGEWAETRDIRDQLVIATKFSTDYKARNPNIHIKVNYLGNNKKNLNVSVEASLKKLRTTYIDILYVHWYDFTTSIEEIMDSLHHLVAQGKVLYLGISDSPAWFIASANRYARDHGKTPFVIYQGPWNVMMREIEREILPMVRHEGMAIAPWNVLAAGKFRSDEEEERRRKTGEKGRELVALYGPGWERNEKEKNMSAALEKVAKEVGTKHLTAVAIAYVMQKVPYVFPIIGGRKVEHLVANIEALDIALTPEQIKYLESVTPFDPGFMAAFMNTDSEYTPVYGATGTFDRQPVALPIRPKAQ
ncbi:hypothetical protein HGRIS_000652 [Hohenbuehelia grisea]|uniref:NADP-dependent oxidoreductase domain-containing protein n=1 Tax=Hohenbuehelia grisea TaxID=104357 RepID=A0ABR3JTK4_9AGAR